MNVLLDDYPRANLCKYAAWRYYCTFVYFRAHRQNLACADFIISPGLKSQRQRRTNCQREGKKEREALFLLSTNRSTSRNNFKARSAMNKKKKEKKFRGRSFFCVVWNINCDSCFIRFIRLLYKAYNYMSVWHTYNTYNALAVFRVSRYRDTEE